MFLKTLAKSRLKRFRCGVALCAAMWISPLHSADNCGVTEPCHVEGGFYRTSPPLNWDGMSALPTAFFLHGYEGSAAQEMDDAGLRRAFSDLGILLIFPNGDAPDYWMHEPPTKESRDEISFIRTVLADVRRRWPVKSHSLWVAGFSNGGFMVWKLACDGQSEFQAYVAISGAFLEPLPKTCDGAPVNLLQVHGLSDEMVPLEGRAVPDGFTQGDLFASFAVLRQLDQCRRDPDHYEAIGPFAVRRWDENCATGKRIAMALHAGAHEMLEGWVELAWTWTRTLPSSATR